MSYSDAVKVVKDNLVSRSTVISDNTIPSLSVPNVISTAPQRAVSIRPVVTPEPCETQTGSIITEKIMVNLISFIVEIFFTCLKQEKSSDNISFIAKCASKHFGSGIISQDSLVSIIEAQSKENDNGD